MADQTFACDGCGNTIVRERYQGRPQLHEFTVPGEGDGEYEHHSYVLCVECRREIVDWIDDSGESDIRADITSLDSAIRGIERQAEGWQALADDLQELKDDA